MGIRSSGNFRFGVWAMAVGLIPLLYVLSVPPIMASKARVVGGYLAWPAWVQTYSKPFLWLSQFDPFRKPLRDYEDWCCNHIEPVRSIRRAQFHGP